jgi:uncharacterized protein
MKCPVCSNTLTEIQAGDVLVDVCKCGCGGVWFDQGELKKFDEPHELDGEMIINTERDVNKKIDFDAVRYCPRCEDEAMCKRYYDLLNQVEVDQCLHCSGIWLDVGELATIRSQYETEAQRIAAADAYLGSLLKQTEDALEDDTKQDLARWDEETSLKGTLRSIFRGLF